VSSPPSTFLLYGSTGFVGDAIARLAVQSGLQPVLAGRNANKLKAQAMELGVQYRVFSLEDATALDQALKEVSVVLHCAGPYLYTFKSMLEGCLRTGVHYLDITGEMPAYEGLAARDAEAKAHGVMLLPGVGFDVVPTDCLALHLKQRLPSATSLTLAFQGQGPAGLPPGTQRTAIEMIPYGSNLVRRNGRLEVSEQGLKTRQIDFGNGLITATRMTWGDVFTAYYSIGIPNIEDYLVLPEATRRQLAVLGYLSPLFKLAAIRNLLKRGVKPGPTADERARTVTNVGGEVTDDQGRRAVSRLNGPEAGMIWTARAALAVVKKVLAGSVSPGFQTPARAYGADFVLECEGVTREDLN
jgi:short subunit dehydrogenase-like uncharacterized protein